MDDKFKTGDLVQVVPEYIAHFDDTWIARLDRGRTGTVMFKSWGRYWVAFPESEERPSIETDFHSLQLQHAKE